MHTITWNFYLHLRYRRFILLTRFLDRLSPFLTDFTNWKETDFRDYISIYVCDYLYGIHDIQDKMPFIALTPLKYENGRVK